MKLIFIQPTVHNYNLFKLLIQIHNISLYVFNTVAKRT